MAEMELVVLARGAKDVFAEFTHVQSRTGRIGIIRSDRLLSTRKYDITVASLLLARH